jgi:hypothetical protein
MVRQQPPCVGRIRLQLDCAAQYVKRCVRAASLTQGDRQLQVHRRGARLIACKRLQHRQGILGLAQNTMRGTQDETSQRVARNDFEDFVRLLRGARGVLPKQGGRMC